MISPSLVLISPPDLIFLSVYDAGEKPLEVLAQYGLRAVCCKPTVNMYFRGTCLLGSYPRSARREKVLNPHGTRLVIS